MRWKDTVGAVNRQFEVKNIAIQAQKAKIIQYSEAVLQQKTTDRLGDVSGGLAGMPGGSKAQARYTTSTSSSRPNGRRS